MNANWISIILILLFVLYVVSLVLMTYSKGGIGSSLSQLRAVSEQYVPTTAFASDSSGLIASIDINNIYIQPKTIIMFYGDTIPSGWVECNGDNGTPDLQGRIPLAFNNSQNSLANKIGNTGGKYEVQLSVAEMPSHTHTGRTNEGGYGTTSFGTSGATSSTADDRDNHTHSFTTDATGGGQGHNNMPPYFPVYFIMKV